MDDHDLRRLVEQMSWQNYGPLSVPGAERPHADSSGILDYLWSQISWSELGNAEATIEEVLDGVRQLPVAFWIQTVAAISVGLAKHGTAETQPDLVEAFRTTPTGSRVHAAIEAAALGEKNRALFSPKPLAALVKLALAHAPSRDPRPGEGNPDLFLKTYLKLCDVAEAANPRATTDPVRNVLRYLVQEGEHGNAGGFAEPLARMDVLLRRIPEELHAVASPSGHLEAALGMPLGRFTALAAAVLAYAAAMDTDNPESINQHLQFNPDDLARLTNATPKEVGAVFGALTLTDEDVEAFRKADPSTPQFYTDLSRLKLHPLWAWDGPDGTRRYTPVSLPFLLWRITDGVYWDVVDAARRTAGAKASNQIMVDFGKYLEVYVQRLVERALPSSPHLAPRYHTSLRAAGKAAGHSPEIDLLFPYGDAFVAVEVKSARFHYVNSVAQGNLDYIEETDLGKMLYDPAAQLGAAIERLQADAYALHGVAYGGQPVYPVLVVYGSLPTLGPVWGYLLNELRERGILQGPNVRSLAALSIDEVEILFALAARGKSIREMIQGYVEGERTEVSFRNYANQVFGDDATPHALLQPDYETTVDRFKGIFRSDEARRSS